MTNPNTFRPSPDILVTPEQFAKLPRYAREEIERLARALAEAQAHIDRSGQSSGNCVVDPYRSYPRHLGDDVSVQYTHEDRVIEVRFGNGVAIVSTEGKKARPSMVVLPRAGNSVLISTLGRGAPEEGR